MHRISLYQKYFRFNQIQVNYLNLPLPVSKIKRNWKGIYLTWRLTVPKWFITNKMHLRWSHKKYNSYFVCKGPGNRGDHLFGVKDDFTFHERKKSHNYKIVITWMNAIRPINSAPVLCERNLTGPLIYLLSVARKQTQC